MSKSESLFQPGTKITLNDFTELSEFEDLVESEIAYDAAPSSHSVWIGRIATKNFLSPDKFYGRLTDIELAVMDDPMRRFKDAIDEKKKYVLGGRQKYVSDDPVERSLTRRLNRASDEFAEMTYERTIGFDFSARATSTGRGTIDQVNTKIWYMPAANLLKRRNGQYYSSVDRVILKPDWDEQRFVDLTETSKRVGFSALRNQIRRPISTPMQK